MNRYQNQEYGHQALLDKVTGELIGLSGIIKQDINGTIEMEVGYHVLRKYWGKGYAPEAAKIFFDYGFKLLPNDSIVSLIDINNIKSQCVADKNGLKRENQIRWKDMDIFVYRMKREDWIGFVS